MAKRMTAEKYYQSLKSVVAKQSDFRISFSKLRYKGGEYQFCRLASKGIKKSDKIILIRAGIHGDEISGPLSLLKYFDEIVDYVHGLGLKLIIYPLGNPSGFEKGLRYNIDNDKGAAGNNDFLRYELSDGTLTDDLETGKKFKCWLWSSDPKLKIKLAKETKLMHRLLKKDPLDQVVACLDLHQDYISPEAPVACYHYAFGNLKCYQKIVGQLKKEIKIWSHEVIGAGYDAGSVMSDDNGFIKRHDGSLTDLCWRLGVKYNVASETTGATAMELAMKVNLIWIKGLADLVSKK
jgi:hypothetical protein